MTAATLPEPARRSVRRKRLRLVLFAPLVIAACAAGFEAVAEWRDRLRFPPPGRMVDVGGRRMHLTTSGQGKPTVVLISGVGGSCEQWNAVMPVLARTERVVAYDRAGLGWSDPAPPPHDAQAAARELHRLLERAGEKRPYLLVGHSFGGMIARVFAGTWPQEVSGLVLLDSPTSEMFPTMTLEAEQAESAAVARQGWWQALGARFGLARMWTALQDAMGAPPPARNAPRLLPYRIVTVAQERAALRESARQAEAVTLPQDLPLIAVSSLRGILPDDPIREAKARLAALTHRGRHWTTERAGHNIHLEEPDLVVEAVRFVMKR